jgi:hypothetical protein
MLLVLLVSSRASAQVRLEGTVLWKDGAPAAGLTVAIPDLSLTATIDANGSYAFESVMPAVRAAVTVVLDGRVLARQFGLFTLPVERLDFRLPGTRAAPGPGIGDAEGVPRSGADVRETDVLPLLGRSDGGAIHATAGQLDAVPTLGAQDVFAALEWLPGISGTEHAEGLFVDGAPPDQSLVRLDGFTLYRVDHLGGQVSAFNMHGVEAVDVSPGAFDARAGERLASAIDVSSPGRPDAVHGGASAGLVDTGGALGLPIGSAVSVWVAGRTSIRSPLDDRILGPTASWTAGFDDAHGRIEVRPSSRDRIGVAAYIGHDDLDGRQVVQMPTGLLDRLSARGLTASGALTASDTQQWRSTGISARWDREWSPRIRTSARLARSDFDWQAQRAVDVADATDGDEGAGELNVLDETTGGLELAASFGSQELAVGAERTAYRTGYRLGSIMTLSSASPVGSAAVITSDINREGSRSLTSAYASHRLALGRLTANSGVRVGDKSAAGEVLVQPRLTVALRLHEKLRATGAWGHYRQVVSRLPLEDLRRGNRGFWTLADGDTIPAATATNGSAGLTFSAGRLLLDAHAFARNLSGLSMLAPRVVGATEGVDLWQFLSHGTGSAKGVATEAQATVGRNSVLVAYTGSRVTYEFPALGGSFPADHHRKHELKIVDAAMIGPFTLSAAWIRANGRPYTALTGVASAAATSAGVTNTLLRLVAGPTNGVRLPPYHRLDLGATYDFRFTENRRATLGVTAFNVSDRANPERPGYAVVGGEVIEATTSLMRRAVNVTLSVRF